MLSQESDIRLYFRRVQVTVLEVTQQHLSLPMSEGYWFPGDRNCGVI